MEGEEVWVDDKSIVFTDGREFIEISLYGVGNGGIEAYHGHFTFYDIECVVANEGHVELIVVGSLHLISVDFQ